MKLLAALALFAAAAPAPAPKGTAAGLNWTVPSEWKEEAPRQMRIATYGVPATKGDADGGEVAVFYFGQGQGGAVDANVQRWVGQFKRPDGSPADKDAKTKKETLNGLPITLVDLRGTYNAGGMMMGPAAPKPGYRLLGAIVEGPEGAVFFKFTGPEKTVGASEKSFHKLLESVKK